VHRSVLTLVVLYSALITTSCSSVSATTGQLTGQTNQTSPALAGTALPSTRTAITPANTGQIVELGRWGKGVIHQLLWARKSQLVAVATSIGVYLLDSTTLQAVRFLDSGSAITCMAISPDGSQLSTGGDDKLVRVCGYRMAGLLALTREMKTL